MPTTLEMMKAHELLEKDWGANVEVGRFEFEYMLSKNYADERGWIPCGFRWFGVLCFRYKIPEPAGA